MYNADFYPPFCSGAGYVMSIDLASIIFELAIHEPKKEAPHIDDAYVTGILASQLGVKHIHLRNGYLVYNNAFIDLRERVLRSILFWHIHDEHSHTNKSKESFHRQVWGRIVARHAKTC